MAVATQPTTPTPTQPQVVVGTKSPGVAAILSFIIAGLGQIYAGRIGRGLLIMFILIPATIIISMMIIYLLPVSLIVWIWQIYDAYNLAKKYNEYLLQTGRPPW